MRLVFYAVSAGRFREITFCPHSLPCLFVDSPMYISVYRIIVVKKAELSILRGEIEMTKHWRTNV